MENELDFVDSVLTFLFMSSVTIGMTAMVIWDIKNKPEYQRGCQLWLSLGCLGASFVMILILMFMAYSLYVEFLNQ